MDFWPKTVLVTTFPAIPGFSRMLIFSHQALIHFLIHYVHSYLISFSDYWKFPLKLHLKAVFLMIYSHYYLFLSWWFRPASSTAVSSFARWWPAARSAFVLTPYGTRNWCLTSASVTCLAWAASVSPSTASLRRPRSALPRRRTNVRYVSARARHSDQQTDSIWTI